MMDLLQWITDPLALGFMQRALLISLVCGITCAVLSCWLTLMGWSLMGDAVSHAVLPGVVLSYVIGVPIAIGALLFGAGSVALIGLVNRTSRVKEDAAMGIVFTGLFALGLILVSVVPSQIDLFHILFGSVLGVSDSDLITAVAIGVPVTVLLLLRRRDLVLFAFDPTHAHALGMSTRRLELILLGALAFTVVVALQAVGVVLVVAMLVTPGATAYLLTDRFDHMLGIAVVGSVLACLIGTYLSFYLDTSTGGAIVVVLTLQFAIAYGIAHLRQRGPVAARA